MVNPDWLKYFLTLVEARNFTAAAEQLHITPQAMSNAIAGLEAHYGQRLVDRGQRMRGLTPAGEALREEAPQILASLANTERRLSALAAGDPAGPVTIGSIGYVNHYILPVPLALLVQRHPGLRPRLFALEPGELESHVASGQLDFALIAQTPERPDLSWAAGPESLYVIVGRPTASPPASPRSWSELDYILPRQFGADTPGGGCPSERHLSGPWPEATHRRRLVAEVDRLETAIHLAEAGIGAAYVPELAVRARIAAGTLAIVAEPPAPYVERLAVVWRKGVRPMPAVLEMLTSLGKG